MNIARRYWRLALIAALGIVLMTSTKPTAAYTAVSTADPVVQPDVGVLFATSTFNAFLRAYLAAHAAGGWIGLVQPPAPAVFFDRN